MTDFLFARASFLEGVARILDFGNTLTEYNRSRDGAEADRRAMQSDWAAVAGDMRSAFSVVENTVGTHMQSGERNVQAQ